MDSNILSMIRDGGILYILLIIALTMHEFGHAWLADRMGDPLPRMQGRVSINPIVHMDKMGSVILPIAMIALSMSSGFPFVFGWGKPVNIALNNPKTRMRVDVISTLGGVGMNLIVALVSSLLVVLFTILNMQDAAQVCVFSIYINCALFIINMIPIPPLDGSRLMKYALRMSDFTYYNIARYGTIIFLFLIIFPETRNIIQAFILLTANVYLYLAQALLNLFQ